MKRIWSPKGKRPQTKTSTRYHWTYLYGFICPQTGDNFFLILPYVTVEIFNLALCEFVQAVGVNLLNQVILVIDGAGFHQGEELKVPAGLHLIFLPPYTPEWQPAEHLWEPADEAIVNVHFQDIDELESVLERRCKYLHTQTDYLRDLCLFHWWPIIDNPPKYYLTSGN